VGADNLTVGLAFVAGFISFISPCVLPLVPAYIGYMGGRMTNSVSAQVNAGGGSVALRPSLNMRFGTVLHGVFFVMGFTFVFVLIGLLSTAFIQQVGGRNINLVTGIIGRFGGVLIMFFGLHVMGVLQKLFNRLQANKSLLENPLLSVASGLLGTAFVLWGFTGTLLPPLTTTMATMAGEETHLQWPTIIALALVAVFWLWLFIAGAFTHAAAFWSQQIGSIQTLLYTDTRRQMQARGGQGYGSSALMGVIFSAGWTPCIGPVYGAVLTMAANTGDVGRAGALLAAYSLGLGVPFLLTALLLDGAQGILKKLQRHMHKIELVSGIFLIGIGFLVATGTLQILSQSLAGQYADVSVNLEEQVIGSLSGQDNAAPTAVPTAEPTADGSTGLNSISDAAAAAAAAAGFEEGNVPPNFEATTTAGETVRLADLRGQVVLVNFWATWCGPCRKEMPDLEALYQQYHDQGFTVLAVNNMETAAQIDGFAKELGLSFPLLLDEKAAVQLLYNVLGYPTSYLIGRDGAIAGRYLGELDAASFETALKQALG
jgi:cytochrome c biogenesis protein CcdA/peroxiredoxin